MMINTNNLKEIPNPTAPKSKPSNSQSKPLTTQHKSNESNRPMIRLKQIILLRYRNWPVR